MYGYDEMYASANDGMEGDSAYAKVSKGYERVSHELTNAYDHGAVPIERLVSELEKLVANPEP